MASFEGAATVWMCWDAIMRIEVGRCWVISNVEVHFCPLGLCFYARRAGCDPNNELSREQQ